MDGHLAGAYGETHKVSALENPSVFRRLRGQGRVQMRHSRRQVPGGSGFHRGKYPKRTGRFRILRTLGVRGAERPESRACQVRCFLSRAAPGHGNRNWWRRPKASTGAAWGSLWATVAMAGHLGMEIDLDLVPCDGAERIDTLLYSETPGRFVVTVGPENKETFHKLFQGIAHACVGKIVEAPDLTIGKRGGRDPATERFRHESRMEATFPKPVTKPIPILGHGEDI